MPGRESRPIRRLHRLPPAVYSKSEYEFFFTVCARHHGEPFINEALAKTVIESLLWTRNQYHWHLFCYCLMPDHLHFVCRLREDQVKLVNGGARGVHVEGVLEHLARFKSFTTNRSWRLGFSGPLWQKSSYDRVFDLAKPVEEIVQYALDNPVRKQLVEDFEQWPYAKIVDPWWE